jgi:CRP/FNR family cyclic AMP-dependent transcriptional regulator
MSEDSRNDASLSVAERFRNIPLFTQLTEEEVKRITEVARQRAYPKNSVILFEDDPGDALYVVLTGEVKVVLIGEDGREVILSILRSGDFFGEMSLIDDQPRSAHVIATEDSNLLVLRRDEFRLCLEQAPRIALGLIPRKITHHMLAQMIGSSRETVSRTIRDLGERGLIEVSRKDIAIRDRPGLEQLAGL